MNISFPSTTGLPDVWHRIDGLPENSERTSSHADHALLLIWPPGYDLRHKLRPALGNLRVREADTGRLDEHIQSIVTAGLKSKARLHKVILTARARCGLPGSRLRRAPRRSAGRILGSVRLRRGASDIHRLGDCCQVEREGDLSAGVDEIDAGYRIVALPPFTIQMLKRLRDDPTYGRMCKVKALREVGGDVVEEENKVALVFPGRGGVLRDPHNFNRTWRAACGTRYKDVTQCTFRNGTTSRHLEMVSPMGGTDRAPEQANLTGGVTPLPHLEATPLPRPTT